MNDEGKHGLEPLRPFLSHSNADTPAVEALYAELVDDGFAPWFDKVSLLGGQDWRHHIKKAINRSDVVIVCLSRSSANARQGPNGFEEEMGYALKRARRWPKGEIFIIPLRLENCPIPASLERFQWVDYFLPAGRERLRNTLDAVRRAKDISQRDKKARRHSQWFKVSARNIFAKSYITVPSNVLAILFLALFVLQYLRSANFTESRRSPAQRLFEQFGTPIGAQRKMPLPSSVQSYPSVDMRNSRSILAEPISQEPNPGNFPTSDPNKSLSGPIAKILSDHPSVPILESSIPQSDEESKSSGVGPASLRPANLGSGFGSGGSCVDRWGRIGGYCSDAYCTDYCTNTVSGALIPIS